MKKDPGDLSVEISGVSMMILGLVNQLDDPKSDHLTPQSLMLALTGASRFLDRIANDLAEL